MKTFSFKVFSEGIIKRIFLTDIGTSGHFFLEKLFFFSRLGKNIHVLDERNS